MRSIDRASRPARGERLAGGGERQIGGQLPGRRNPALADACSLGDPLIGSIDLAGEVHIGENVVRQITATAEHDRADYRHEGTLRRAHSVAPAGLPSICEILACNS